MAIRLATSGTQNRWALPYWSTETALTWLAAMKLVDSKSTEPQRYVLHKLCETMSHPVFHSYLKKCELKFPLVEFMKSKLTWSSDSHKFDQDFIYFSHLKSPIKKMKKARLWLKACGMQHDTSPSLPLVGTGGTCLLSQLSLINHYSVMLSSILQFFKSSH